MKLSFLFFISISLFNNFTYSCAPVKTEEQVENHPKDPVQLFLDDYTKEFVILYFESAEAEWASNTRIVEGDTINAYRTRHPHATKFYGITATGNFLKGILKHGSRKDLRELTDQELNAPAMLAYFNPLMNI